MDEIDLNLQDKIKESQVKEAVKGFILDDNTIDKLKTTFETQLELGLKDSLITGMPTGIDFFQTGSGPKTQKFWGRKFT